MAETTGPNGHDANPPAESRVLSLDSVRRPIGKAGDYITRQQAADMVRDALASEIPKIHSFYLDQIPNFVARMIQDALLHYGLIKAAEPVDIQPAPGGVAATNAGTQAPSTDIAAGDTPRPDVAVESPTPSDSLSAHPSDWFNPALPWVLCAQCGKSHRNIRENGNACRCATSRWTFHAEKPDAPSWEDEALDTRGSA